MKKEHMTDRSSPEWRTIGVTALPAGWCNQYRTNDGGGFIEPVPALLLQQSGDETRVAFASYESGRLTAAADNPLYVDSMLTPDAVVRPPKRTGPPPR